MSSRTVLSQHTAGPHPDRWECLLCPALGLKHTHLPPGRFGQQPPEEQCWEGRGPASEALGQTPLSVVAPCDPSCQGPPSQPGPTSLPAGHVASGHALAVPGCSSCLPWASLPAAPSARPWWWMSAHRVDWGTTIWIWGGRTSLKGGAAGWTGTLGGIPFLRLGALCS